MNKLAAVSLCLVLASPAFAQSVGEKTGVNSMLGVSPTTADFVKEAAISDMFEIQSSELAETKVTDPQTKTFAERMVKDHKKTSSDLKMLVDSGKVKAEIPTQLDSSHQSMLDKLKGLDGADFTKQYHSDQDSGHKDAVSLFKRYADGGDNADLKAWAGKTLPTLDDHLKMAKDLDRQS
jgi:putative membrane protein